MANRSRASGLFYTPGFPPGVKWLLISNAAVFILGFFAGKANLDRPLAYLVLVPAEVMSGYIWQLATYMFLHGGFSHILWNMLALWWFGTDLERLWGTRRFLEYYLMCGVGAGVCVVLLNYALPWGSPQSATLGSSGAIYGILIANAVLFPTRTVLIYFLIPIQMKYLVMIYGAVAFLGSFQVNSGVSNFAHLGGMLFGYIWLKKPRSRPGSNAGAVARLRGAYQRWKIQRAKRKFEVYMKKQGRDPWVH